jgi:hypothetical protein
MEHSAKNTKLEKFLSGLICFDSRENQCYSAVFLPKAKQSDKPRDLETDLIQGLEQATINCLSNDLHINSCMICTQRMEI